MADLPDIPEPIIMPDGYKVYPASAGRFVAASDSPAADASARAWYVVDAWTPTYLGRDGVINPVSLRVALAVCRVLAERLGDAPRVARGLLPLDIVERLDAAAEEALKLEGRK